MFMNTIDTRYFKVLSSIFINPETEGISSLIKRYERF